MGEVGAGAAGGHGGRGRRDKKREHMARAVGGSAGGMSGRGSSMRVLAWLLDGEEEAGRVS